MWFRCVCVCVGQVFFGLVTALVTHFAVLTALYSDQERWILPRKVWWVLKYLTIFAKKKKKRTTAKFSNCDYNLTFVRVTVFLFIFSQNRILCISVFFFNETHAGYRFTCSKGTSVEFVYGFCGNKVESLDIRNAQRGAKHNTGIV